mgnify:FL=1
MNLGILNAIGNTPMVEVSVGKVCFMAKLECMNPFGSMKDRAAKSALLSLLQTNTIDKETTIVESSSGNFAIALSGVCSAIGIKCLCVVDSNITNTNSQIIKQFGSTIHKINTPEKNQSYQEKRIETVKELLRANNNMYWTNQYNNPLIQESYYSLADEILSQYPKTESVYIPVSTCGTISGVSTRLKEQNPNIEIVAVDSYGSQIFGERISRNRFTGMGSRIKPGNLANAIIDRVVRVSDFDCITSCRKLLEHGLFVGASSGADLSAIIQTNESDKNIVAIFPDRGDRYLDNLYNDEWLKDNMPQLLNEQKIIYGLK